MTGTGGMRKRLKKVIGFLTKSRRGKRLTQGIKKKCGTCMTVTYFFFFICVFFFFLKHKTREDF